MNLLAEAKKACVGRSKPWLEVLASGKPEAREMLEVMKAYAAGKLEENFRSPTSLYKWLKEKLPKLMTVARETFYKTLASLRDAKA